MLRCASADTQAGSDRRTFPAASSIGRGAATERMNATKNRFNFTPAFDREMVKQLAGIVYNDWTSKFND